MGCLYLLVIVHRAAINILVQVFVWKPVSIPFHMYIGLARKFIQVFPIKWYGKTHTNFLANPLPRKEITRLYSNSMFNFLRKHQIVLQSTVPFYISTSNAQGFQFLHIFPNTCNFPFFFKWPSQWMYCLISHTPSAVSVWFSSAFPQWLKPFSIFSCIYWLFGLFFFLEKCLLCLLYIIYPF